MPDNLITAAQLQRFAPSCDALALAPALDQACAAHAINTPRRLRHFLAQLHHESSGFTRLAENLNYSAQRLTEVWPRRFPTLAAAAPFAGNPQALAEQVYGGRLGNNAQGDGWRFRGRGLIQLTGRTNYGRASAWSGLDLIGNPDLAGQPRAAAEIAASFWATEGLNQVVDSDPDESACAASLGERLRLNEADDLEAATQAVNGGANGLDDRARQLLRAATIWKD